MRPGEQPTNYSDEDDDVSTDKPQGDGESEKKSAENLRKRITNVTSEGTEEQQPPQAAAPQPPKQPEEGTDDKDK